MTYKDESETVTKDALEWLTRVGAISTVLAGVLGLFLPEDNAKKFAWGLALLFAVGSAFVYLYQRRREAKLKITEFHEPLMPSAALRGLLPFEEGDPILGRGRDVQELYTLVTSSIFRFGVLWGISGCGKTSLLRAGLIPKLQNEKFLPLFINRPRQDIKGAISVELLKRIPNSSKYKDKSLNQLLKLVAKDKKVIIIIDQFEEFFLTHRSPQSRTTFVKWMGDTIADEGISVAFLIAIRSDFFAHLHTFAPQVPEPTSTHTTYQLQEFDVEQAKQVFSAAAKSDGIAFEPSLVQEVIRDLEMGGFVRPAELQIIGTRLKRKNILTLNRYEALGGARSILSSYISDEVKQSSNQNVARLILRMMCAETIESRSLIDLSLDEILKGIPETELAESIELNSRATEIKSILEQFVVARVLLHTDEDKYNLTHDYLAAYVHSATKDVETNVERANRLLKRYIAEYKDDPRVRIPFRQIRWIQSYASAESRNGNKAKELIRKSRQQYYFTINAIYTTLLIFLALSYAYFTTLFGFNLFDYAFGPNIIKRENPFIQLSAGEMIFGSIAPDIGLGEAPITKIHIETFVIQKMEVTNHEYRICRLAKGCKSDPIIRTFFDNLNYEDHPVVYVNAFQAREFCKWLGGDLPSSEQWERAARGLDGRPWPWLRGDLPTPELANIYFPQAALTEPTKASDFQSGATPEGALNLLGNVWEWTLSQLTPRDDGTFSSSQKWDGVDSQFALVMRGGSFGWPMARITEIQPAYPENNGDSIGFRCVINPH